MIITVVIFIRLGEMTKLPIIEGIAIAKNIRRQHAATQTLHKNQTKGPSLLFYNSSGNDTGL